MKKCLGIFDSGIGGLTVLKEIEKEKIYDQIIYLGDTGRVPYGTRSVETIIRYAKEDVDFLIKKGATEIIVACGTVSSVAMDELKKYCPIPITGMVDNAVISAAKASPNYNIGIIGTEATIKNKAFEDGIKKLINPNKIISTACPLFVSLVEYGFANEDKILEEACHYYLKEMRESKIDTLIMGCTHFPILEKHFKKYFGNINFINMGKSVVETIKHERQLSNKVNITFFVTDSVENFLKGATIFYDKIDKKNVKKIKL